VPVVLSIEATIDLILKNKLSVIRFGDGELSLIDGIDLPFQKRNQKLVDQLEKIIRVDDKKLLICIPGIWGKLDAFAPFAYSFIMHHVYRYGHLWKNLLSNSRIYGDSYITRHYLAFNDKSNAKNLFKKLFRMWDNENVLLIEGEKSRNGVGNDMFNNVQSLNRILCPAENAFDRYNEILTEALKTPKENLILISLGPTAKVLAYDLFTRGYRVIDTGHMDMEYEMFLRKQDKQIRVKNKYFNEINERNPEECFDASYLSQIITKIV
jgi:glycosyltransferase family protein